MTPPDVKIPKGPISLDRVIEEVAPEVRQSVLASFDDCALSAYFDLDKAWGWNTTPQAAGVLFHRFAAEFLRELRAMDSASVPVGVALAILEETLLQKGVPAEERVRVPIREIPALRQTVVKFAKDNSFTTRNIVDVERRLRAPLSYTDEEGEVRERILTGQVDALIADPDAADGAIVLDWKYTWALPPQGEAADNEENANKLPLSYHGYFQQRFYAWLILKNYPAINRVTLREFYPRRTKKREATITRSLLPEIEEKLRYLVRDLDFALASGAPKKPYRIPGVAPWMPSPGKHCGFCVAPQKCPIEKDARERYAITNESAAKRAVAEIKVAEAVIENRKGGLRVWVEEHGPVPVRWSKGRLVFGLFTQKGGKGRPVLRFFSPNQTDRPSRDSTVDANLQAALEKSTDEA